MLLDSKSAEFEFFRSPSPWKPKSVVIINLDVFIYELFIPILGGSYWPLNLTVSSGLVCISLPDFRAPTYYTIAD